jgi:hypothetical protein
MASVFASRCLRASGGLARHSVSSKLALHARAGVAVQPFARFDHFGTRCLSVKVGDPIPSVSLDKGFPPEKVPLADYCKGKKIVLVGLPGAFTPT